MGALFFAAAFLAALGFFLGRLGWGGKLFAVPIQFAACIGFTLALIGFVWEWLL